MVIGFASDPLTGSSTLLAFEARLLSTVTLSDVPAGIVTSRNFGAGGPTGSGGAAGVGLDGRAAWVTEAAGLDSGVGDCALDVGDAAGVVCPVAVDCGGPCWEHAMTSVEANVSTQTVLITFHLPESRAETSLRKRTGREMRPPAIDPCV